jgi:hypothetical protein
MAAAFETTSELLRQGEQELPQPRSLQEALYATPAARCGS